MFELSSGAPGHCGPLYGESMEGGGVGKGGKGSKWNMKGKNKSFAHEDIL